MVYFRPSPERALVAKRFLTAREVEDMAATGTVEIVQVDGLVITDAARETAHDLGLRIKQPERQAHQEANPSAREREAPRRVETPATSSSTANAASSARGLGGVSPLRDATLADPLLQALIQAVRSNRTKLAAIAEGT